MEVISNYANVNKKISCIGCARERGEITLGNIKKTKYFDIHQDFETPILGFLIISSRRHIKTLDELTLPEQKDFIRLLCNARLALKKVLKVKIIYLIQREDAGHHFHICLFPRYPWMLKQFGGKLKSLEPIIDYAKSDMKTKANIQKIEKSLIKLKKFFNNK